jgi:hypothetical protein
MAKTIGEFIKDIDRGIVSLEDFNQGLYDLYKRVIRRYPYPHDRRLPFHLREETKHLTAQAYPHLFGALCLYELTQKVWAIEREQTLVYETSTGEDKNNINPTLLSGLRALAFVIGLKQDERNSPTQIEPSQFSLNDLMTGAFFSARSLRHLEPEEDQMLNTLSSQSLGSERGSKDEPGPQESSSLPSIAPVADTQRETGNKYNTNWALGDVIATVFGDELKHNASCSRYETVMKRWSFLLHDGSCKTLQPHLSIEQANTARMLREWWQGSTDFESAVNESRDAVHQIILSGNLSRESLQCSVYHQALRSLFVEEFMDASDEAGGSTLRLAYREAFATVAAAQRLAMSVYRSLIEQHDKDGMNATAYDRSIGASISPCAWLPEVSIRNAMPYYLWDVKNRRCIVSREWREPVEYTAISHTWGRWKIHGYVQIEGVEGWLIPRNKRFDVAKLPDLLADAGFETSYVWFDLLCIPQEPESDRLKQIARDEIGRQAKIFRGAKYAAAWLNTVDGWTGLHVALRRLTINYLMRDKELPAWILDIDGGNREVELELASDPEDVSTELMIDGWFSSLWTLQELCLRPDMVLFDRQWHAFTLGGPGNPAIRLDDLVALWQMQATVRVDMHPEPDSDAWDILNDTFKSVRGVTYLFTSSGLQSFPNASRTTILTLGNQRHCTARRAEAIMSAIDVTDWYYDDSQQQSPDHGYSLPFLREAALKIGPDFYSASFQTGELAASLFSAYCLPSDSSLPQRGPGTMLPFGTGLFAKAQSHSTGFSGTTHPSMNAWTLQADHSIHIRQAGIISYTGQRRSAERRISASLHAPFPGSRLSLDVENRPDVDLDHWIESYYPQTRNFAVCLRYGQHADGVLLKEVVTGDLVKVGTFAINSDSASLFDSPPKTYEVNWCVL